MQRVALHDQEKQTALDNLNKQHKTDMKHAKDEHDRVVNTYMNDNRKLSEENNALKQNNTKFKDDYEAIKKYASDKNNSFKQMLKTFEETNKELHETVNVLNCQCNYSFKDQRHGGK